MSAIFQKKLKNHIFDVHCADVYVKYFYKLLLRNLGIEQCSGYNKTMRILF